MDTQTEKVTNKSGIAMNDIKIAVAIIYCHQVQTSAKGKSELQEPCQKSAVDIRLITGIARKSRMLNTRKTFLVTRNFRLMIILQHDLMLLAYIPRRDSMSVCSAQRLLNCFTQLRQNLRCCRQQTKAPSDHHVTEWDGEVGF